MIDQQGCPFPIGPNGARCGKSGERQPDFLDRFECDVCKGCKIDNRLVRAPTTLDDWNNAIGATRQAHEQHLGFPRLHYSDKYTTVVRAESDGATSEITAFPRSVAEKAAHLLRMLVSMSRTPGHGINIKFNKDFPLAYAVNAKELRYYLEYLESLKMISTRDRTLAADGMEITVTPVGHKADAERAVGNSLRVFISSTCHDLHDCRAELASHLQAIGCEVLASDNPELFDVETSSHSIESCLFNLVSSDIVLCIVDRRYGSPLDKFGYPGKSATQVEVEYAKANGIPIYFFIRKQAFTEHGLMKKLGPREATTSWVEADDSEKRERWFNFVSGWVKPSDDNNWADQFDSVVDLKRMVTRRIKSVHPRR